MKKTYHMYYIFNSFSKSRRPFSLPETQSVCLVLSKQLSEILLHLFEVLPDVVQLLAIFYLVEGLVSLGAELAFER